MHGVGAHGANAGTQAALTGLAQSWLNFAAEIERAQVLLGQHGERGNGLDRSGAPNMEATEH
jgi:hypothetical protein